MHQLGGGITVFAGQRAEGFYVDLGSIFDLGDLRPFENLHATFGLPGLKAGPGVNATNHLNVHSIAIQVPVSALTRSGHPTIGVWTTASRQRVRLWDADNGENVDSGPFRQVSRLGNPLVNEVLIPLGHKDQWNSLPPSDDKRFASYVDPSRPGGAAARPVPRRVPPPGRAGRGGQAAGRPAGHPAHRHPHRDHPRIHQLHRDGAGRHAPAEHLHRAHPVRQAEHLRAARRRPGGFPNGRRVTDDVVAIELRALAGVTYPLIDKTFTPDAAAGQLTDGLTPASVSDPPLGQFPYLGVPYSGFNNPS